MTPAQRAYLRRLAHALPVTVMIGKHGLTENILSKVEQELDAHELIKVRFIDYKDMKEELVETIVATTGAMLVAMIGHTTILYRPHRDPARRKIHV
ncbi:YhbY family RNA-binding protein [uncultured Chloroflexus sp.]|uniref:YhbY family RNA-binding protein n=1 Tax=uncultured Chloroflexus sp. TaxID=214040 RepID=UPI00262F26AA|nr:YhbY family RNA-binding protein [uncultured Chloroflexus sp.]